MTIKDKIREIIAKQLDVQPENIPLDVSFGEIGSGYVDNLLIVMRLEEVFKISISNEEVGLITTLRKAIECVDKKEKDVDILQ